MGVPGYFSWIHRKYPWLVRKVKQNIKKQVDCLYIDVNGICYQYARDEHNYNYLLQPKTMEEIFKQIIDHIDSIIETVDPQLQVYLMLDGTCPRAKMNQQRQRRFHAQMNHDKVKEALENHGFTVQKETVPNNSIAPGTTFMFELNAQLRHYIEARIALSSQEFTEGEAGHKEHTVSYKNLQFILSDSNAPGEGEHKILEVIRKHTNYQLTHCIVGADADLLLLSLATIGKRILILRESFKFKGEKGELDDELDKLQDIIEKEKANPAGPSHKEYDLVDINGLKRVILDNYKSLFDNKFPKYLKYDPMALMDDFVFLSLFAGNDFLPRQNYMQIKMERNKQHILDLLVDKYDNYIQNATCYLSERGTINFGAIIEFFRQVAQIEPQFKNDVFERSKNPVEKSVIDYVKIMSQHQIADSEKIEDQDLIDLDLKEVDLKLYQTNSKHEEEEIIHDLNLPNKEEREREEKKMKELLLKQEKELQEQEEADQEDEQDDFNKKKKKNKKGKYQQKHHKEGDPDDEQLFKILNDEVHGKEIYLKEKLAVKTQEEYDIIIMKYLEGFQFSLLYYFRGIEKASWNYFFPHFYAPLTQDIVDFLERNPKFNVKFAQTVPFVPFKQELGILHPDNEDILPPQFKGLFEKYLKPFCPTKLEIDKYGATMEHMQIIKLPFIDLSVLDKAYHEGETALLATGTEYEKARNTRSQDILFSYNKDSKVDIPVFNKLIHKTEIKAAPVSVLVFSHLDPVLPTQVTDLIVDMEKKNAAKQKYEEAQKNEKQVNQKKGEKEEQNKPEQKNRKKSDHDDIDPEEADKIFHGHHKKGEHHGEGHGKSHGESHGEDRGKGHGKGHGHHE